MTRVKRARCYVEPPAIDVCGCRRCGTRPRVRWRWVKGEDVVGDVGGQQMTVGSDAPGRSSASWPPAMAATSGTRAVLATLAMSSSNALVALRVILRRASGPSGAEGLGRCLRSRRSPSLVRDGSHAALMPSCRTHGSNRGAKNRTGTGLWISEIDPVGAREAERCPRR